MIAMPRRCFVSGFTAWIAIVVASGSAQTQRAPAQTSSPATAPAGNAVEGNRLFNAYGCWQCHGRHAQGSSAGPRLGPGPIPFPAMVAYVRRPTNQMPPFSSKVVTDTELADIHTF